MAIKGPLTGARILSFGSAHAGNYCAKILGDLGAEILKIGNSLVLLKTLWF